MAITLTETAVAEVKRILEAQGFDETTSLRMGVDGGGCSGMQYALGFDNDAIDPEVDAVYDNGGVKVVAQKKFALHLDGTTIDFLDGPTGAGFKIDNPNQPTGGGCAGCGGGHH
jgi:iron-sulfur cluster assembly protein